MAQSNYITVPCCIVCSMWYARMSYYLKQTHYNASRIPHRTSHHLYPIIPQKRDPKPKKRLHDNRAILCVLLLLLLYVVAFACFLGVSSWVWSLWGIYGFTYHAELCQTTLFPEMSNTQVYAYDAYDYIYIYIYIYIMPMLHTVCMSGTILSTREGKASARTRPA